MTAPERATGRHPGATASNDSTMMVNPLADNRFWLEVARQVRAMVDNGWPPVDALMWAADWFSEASS